MLNIQLKNSKKLKINKYEQVIECLHLAGQSLQINTLIKFQLNYLEIISHQSLSCTKSVFSEQLLQYLLYLINLKKFKVSTLQLTLSIASRFKQKYSQNEQLTILVSLFLASKILQTDSLTVSQLHRFSDHCFTNREVYSCQNKILESLNYNILQEGIVDEYIKILLSLLSEMLYQVSYDILLQITEDIQKYLWCYLFSNQSQQQINLLVLSVAIINISLILSTQCTGRFPHLVWLCKITNLPQILIQNATDNYLRVVVGRQTYKQLRL